MSLCGVFKPFNYKKNAWLIMKNFKFLMLAKHIQLLFPTIIKCILLVGMIVVSLEDLLYLKNPPVDILNFPSLPPISIPNK